MYQDVLMQNVADTLWN